MKLSNLCQIGKLLNNEKILLKTIRIMLKTIIKIYKKKEVHIKIQVAQIRSIIKLLNLKTIVNKTQQQIKKDTKKLALHQNLHRLLQTIVKKKLIKTKQIILDYHLHHLHAPHKNLNQISIFCKLKNPRKKEKDNNLQKINKFKERVLKIIKNKAHLELQVLHQEYLPLLVHLQVVPLKKK